MGSSSAALARATTRGWGAAASTARFDGVRSHGGSRRSETPRIASAPWAWSTQRNSTDSIRATGVVGTGDSINGVSGRRRGRHSGVRSIALAGTSSGRGGATRRIASAANGGSAGGTQWMASKPTAASTHLQISRPADIAVRSDVRGRRSLRPGPKDANGTPATKENRAVTRGIR